MRAAFSVSRAGDGLELFLDEGLAPCTMACRFCTAPLRNHDRTVPRDPRGLWRARQDLQRILDREQPEHIDLVSDDITRFPWIDDLLDVAAARGVAVRVLTPGVHLTDAWLAARGDRPLRFHLTWLATDDGTWDRITQRPGTAARVRAAAHRLLAAGYGLDLCTVLTVDNADQLVAIVAEAASLGIEHFTVRSFHPDIHHAPAGWAAQFPDFHGVAAALREVLSTDGPAVELTNVPWCQIPVDLASHPRLHISDADNAYVWREHAACVGCPAFDRCGGLHPAYAVQYPDHPAPDRARATLALEAAEAAKRLREGEQQVVPADRPQDRALAFGEPVAGFIVGAEAIRAEGGYFFTADGIGLYYRSVLDDERFGRAQGVIRRIVRSLREGEPRADAVVEAVEALEDGVRAALEAP